MLRAELPPLPKRIAALPVDDRGYPVPFFVAFINGKPDFRVIDPEKMQRCISEKLCWVCGDPLTRNLAFTIGPMCAINRVSSEPPSHLECAMFSAIACPFLSRPHMTRRENDLPCTKVDPAGVSIARNPGATLVWLTRSFTMFRHGDGVLFNVGDPTDVLWFCKGREATREEVLESINSGIPIIRKVAEEDGPEALEELRERINVALTLVPKQ